MPLKPTLPRKIGYARVSTADQNLDLQIDALRQAGCHKIFSDHGVSGGVRHRPELDRALGSLRAGDQLVVWKLDRLGRSLAHLIEILDALKSRGVHFESLTEKIDTTSIYGEFIFHLIAAMAQMERKIISERTRAGLEAARKRGAKLGRRPSLSARQVQQAKRQREIGTQSVRQIADEFNVSEMTVYRAL